MMKWKRTLLLSLCAALLLPPLASCAKGSGAESESQTSAGIESTAPDSVTEPETDAPLALAVTDFGGAKLRILGTSENYGYGYYKTDDIWVEAQTGEPMNDAVFDRNLACEDRYNFSIDFRKSDAVRTDITKNVAAGLDEYDLFFENWYTMWSLAGGGNMRDLREIETIDLANEWWDPNANRDLSVANRLFYTVGELTTIDDRQTRFIYFNKQLVEDYHLTDPYEAVKNNTWTLDTFYSMATGVSDDLDGNGVINDADRSGFFSENGTVTYLLLGCGLRYVTLDSDGYPRYSFLQNSDDYTVLEKICTMLADKNVTQWVNTYTDIHGYSNRYTYGRSLFAAGQHLFTLGGAQVIEEFREMEDEFGILPVPKYTSEQERYYHTSDASSVMFAVPITAQDTDTLGLMLEYYSYEGMRILTPVLRETLLERKYTRDAESADMLKIIFASKTFELANVANWASVVSVADNAAAAGKTPAMSSYKKIGAAMDKLVQADYEKALNAGK